MVKDGHDELNDFHFRMDVNFANKYIHLIPEEDRLVVLAAVIAHDSIEDVRKTYNDIRKMALTCHVTEGQATKIAEMVRAVTNDGRGRDRNERMPDYIYEEIRTIIHSLFVKLCDRMANVQYGIVTGSSKPANYKKENVYFKEKLYNEGRLKVCGNVLMSYLKM